jgi:hypothetical protein
MTPLPLRALDLSRHGKNIVMRIVTDKGNVDLSVPRSHALGAWVGNEFGGATRAA